MGIFRVVHISQTKDHGPGEFSQGWAVDRSGPGEQARIVSRLFETEAEAKSEAERLSARRPDDA
jgi:hypothetical protein